MDLLDAGKWSSLVNAPEGSSGIAGHHYSDRSVLTGFSKVALTDLKIINSEVIRPSASTERRKGAAVI